MEKIFLKLIIWDVKKLKILEYKPNFGTLSAGLEAFKENKVVEALYLDKNAVYGYNRIHKQWFPPSFTPLLNISEEIDVDLAIFNPDFGENINKRGKENFFFYDFQTCLDFLKRNSPEFAIFQTEVDVIPHVNTSNSYVRDGFGQLSKDRIIDELQQMGYKAYLAVMDEANYGIPLHRSFAFYIATPLDFHLTIPKALYTATGKGSYAKYRTVADAIGDLGVMGDWVLYSSGPQNVYQRLLRDDKVCRVTWHHPPNIKKATKEKIVSVQQGSNNETKFARARSKGFNRAKWDDICRCMDEKFYLPSSKLGDSIHPIHNRPFTIREGCRIHGLPDRLSFDLKTSRPAIAKMIHNSVAPAIGQILGLALGCKL